MADSAFSPIVPPTLVGVTDIEYVMKDNNDTAQTMEYFATLSWSDGTQSRVSGNVVPHLTNPEISGLQALMARLRTKAEAAWGQA